jgi:hypothetical protein
MLATWKPAVRGLTHSRSAISRLDIPLRQQTEDLQLAGGQGIDLPWEHCCRRPRWRRVECGQRLGDDRVRSQGSALGPCGRERRWRQMVTDSGDAPVVQRALPPLDRGADVIEQSHRGATQSRGPLPMPLIRTEAGDTGDHLRQEADIAMILGQFDALPVRGACGGLIPSVASEIADEP